MAAVILSMLSCFAVSTVAVCIGSGWNRTTAAIVAMTLATFCVSQVSIVLVAIHQTILWGSLFAGMTAGLFLFLLPAPK